MQSSKFEIIVFLIVTTVLVLLLAGLIVTLVYFYQKKQLVYQNYLEDLKLDHEKNLMAAQLEIQENTFQHISKEIHDNINLSLTLAKLHLNTLEGGLGEKTIAQVNASIELITKSIENLSDISKGLNSDIISSQGLIIAIENEVSKVSDTGLFTVNLQIKGSPVYMNLNKELIIFRILQEAFNNILKHSNASDVGVILHYNDTWLNIKIWDNGNGFSSNSDLNELNKTGKAGLKNMDIRTKSLSGQMQIETSPGLGTKLLFYIPY